MTDFAVVGDWHLASVFAPVLADLGYSTQLISTQGPPVDVSYPLPPILEPGLDELLNKHRYDTKRLSYGGALRGTWRAKWVWLAVDTPVNEDDEVDLSPVEKVFEILQAHPETEIVFVSSQVPVGFCRHIQAKIKKPVCYVPENLRLGKGIETFQRADRTVIGCDDAQLGQKIEKILSGFQTTFFHCDLPSAEMIKHATNAFLATSISFANQIAAVAQAVGANPLQVGQALKLDKRIGSQAYVIPGLGFAGGTLPRDLKILQSLAREHQVPVPLVDSVLEINRMTSQTLLGWLKWYKEKHAQSLNILLMGYTYKSDANTLRRSLTVELAQRISRAYPADNLVGYDPVMQNSDLGEFPASFSSVKTWPENEKFDVVLLMTPRPEFRGLWQHPKIPAHAETLLLDVVNLFSEPLKAPLTYRRLWDARG